MRSCNPLSLALAILLVGGVGAVLAVERRPANVPPTLEIEVLDPNADSQGRPAVELRQVDGVLQVDIPPTVLVHRYYYTGDRSFQAQLLPGGPSVVVVNHPRTGERCYIEVQMMPGAPRVTYTGHSIQYDHGEHAITIHFGLLTKPVVRYRSGKTWPQKVGQVVHAEQLREGAHRLGTGLKRGMETGGDVLKEAAIDTHEFVKTAALPVQNLVRVMPLGAALFDPDRALVRDQKIAQHHQEQALRRVALEQRRAEQTFETNR